MPDTLRTPQAQWHHPPLTMPSLFNPPWNFRTNALLARGDELNLDHLLDIGCSALRPLVAVLGTIPDVVGTELLAYALKGNRPISHVAADVATQLADGDCIPRAAVLSYWLGDKMVSYACIHGGEVQHRALDEDGYDFTSSVPLDTHLVRHARVLSGGRA